MAQSGRILAATLDLMQSSVRPGIKTGELDRIAEDFIRSQGAVPTFKGYRGFPGSICSSPNAMIVHGIPGAYKLKGGDIISIDVGVTLDGWVSDAARTYVVGTGNLDALRLSQVTRQSLAAGIAAATVGHHLGDIGNAVQSVVEAAGFSCVESLVGHGVGRAMHEPPNVPNFGTPGTGEPLVAGGFAALRFISLTRAVRKRKKEKR